MDFYQRWMKILFLNFDLWGFSTQFIRSPNHSIIYRLIFFCHLILGSFVSFDILTILARPYFDILGQLNDSSKLGACIFLYWLSIIELFSKHKLSNKLWNIIEKIDEEFWSFKKDNFRSYILKLLLYTNFVIAAFFNFVRIFLQEIYTFQINKIHIPIFWCCFTFFMLFRLNQQFYYLFVLEFIKKTIKVLNYESCELMVTLRIDGRRFKWFCKFYDTIHDLNDVINNIFDWSNFVAILFSFQLILNDINWFYWRILNRFELDIFGNKL